MTLTVTIPVWTTSVLSGPVYSEGPHSQVSPMRVDANTDTRFKPGTVHVIVSSKTVPSKPVCSDSEYADGSSLRTTVARRKHRMELPYHPQLRHSARNRRIIRMPVISCGHRPNVPNTRNR